ncbi:DUF3592 domain-containing protein [Streptomyces genisteinicus]|uniref:DUF3592 domain-containing protein n=1 Tax=Streptomyces genisteinicus TaxID=2768068 RepID=A0A7H0HWW6_9ACTN|nr:DUF3592 domain-containing protein [Streptomyces genisteinicus]QNP65032.1 DUF3592 domain-containing protein [Streptomyces genisteinicus]
MAAGTAEGQFLLGVTTLLLGVLTAFCAGRLAGLLRAVRHAVTTGGECVRVEPSTRRCTAAARHWFAFRTATGEVVEFEDFSPYPMSSGTPVTVRYRPEDPRGTASVTGTCGRSPVLRGAVAAAGCALVTAGSAALFLTGLP